MTACLLLSILNSAFWNFPKVQANVDHFPHSSNRKKEMQRGRERMKEERERE
jgi:hypothetical protein